MIFMIKVMEIKAGAERKKCGLFPGAGRVKSPSRRCSAGGSKSGSRRCSAGAL